MVSHVGVYSVCKVEHGGTFRKLHQVAFRCEDEYLIFIEIHLELVNHLSVIIVLQCPTDACQPFVHAAFSLYSFVSPVCGKSTFSHFVHTFGAYLHLHPFVFRSLHCDVQALISIGFWHTEPVTQSFRIRLIHICHKSKHVPALHLFQFQWRVEDYSDGKKVIDAFKVALLLLHLLPDAVNTFRSAFHVELEPVFLEFLLYRCDEAFYVFVAACLSLVELVFNHVICVMLKIFQAKIFQFTFQFIQTELVCERGI